MSSPSLRNRLKVNINEEPHSIVQSKFDDVKRKNFMADLGSKDSIHSYERLNVGESVPLPSLQPPSIPAGHYKVPPLQTPGKKGTRFAEGLSGTPAAIR